jgi:hypothetical protein
MKAIILTVILVSTNAFADNLFAVPETSHNKAPSIQGATQCKDFSGTWAGTCQDSEGERAISVKVTQIECAGIYFDSVYYPIGGTHQVQDITPSPQGDYVSSSSTSVNWGSNYSFLAAVTHVFVTQTGKVLYANTLHGGLTVDGNKMYSAVKGQGVDVACTLEKQ